MVVRLIAINGQHRENRNQVNALAKHIRKGGIICVVVVRVQGQNASGQSVHHVLGRRFHNNVTHKVLRQGLLLF
mgnify:FL=1